jgi:hypothetical protein
VGEDIPADVREFLQRHVETYEQLEVLLLLCRERQRPWTAEAVGAKLRLSTLMVVKSLDDLTRARLVDHLRVGNQSTFTFRPGSSRTATTVEELLRIYDDSPLKVIHLMNSSALDRVRSAAARTFADAFVIDPKRK